MKSENKAGSDSKGLAGNRMQARFILIVPGGSGSVLFVFLQHSG